MTSPQSLGCCPWCGDKLDEPSRLLLPLTVHPLHLGDAIGKPEKFHAVCWEDHLLDWQGGGRWPSLTYRSTWVRRSPVRRAHFGELLALLVRLP